MRFKPGIPLDISILIYTLSGNPVQHIENQPITTSSYANISWDGRDWDYDRLGNGTYIYVLRVITEYPVGKINSRANRKARNYTLTS